MKSNIKVAVLGGGNGSHAMAADLKSRGFEVNMFEMEKFKHNLQKLFDTKTIETTGVITGKFTLDKVTSNIEEAIAGVKYILVVTPAFAHSGYAELLKGKVSKDQIIVIYPGAFSSLVFRKEFGDVDCPVIAEANNLPYDARMTEPCKVNVFGLNNINIAFLPAEKGGELIDEMRLIHPYQKVYEDVLEAGFSIVNPALHSGPCLLNVGAIEYWGKGEFYMYEHGFTPSAAKVDIKLDNERKEIGKKFGYHLRPIEDFSGMREGYTWQELYMSTHGNISLTPIKGPNDINNRYLTEDAPYGLVPWSSIAKQVGVETPIIDSVVNIYNIIHEKNWWEEGRNVSQLGLEGMALEDIKRYLKTGKK